MIVQLGKASVTWTRADLEAKLAGHARVLIDVGTGDGRFVYRSAGAHPDTYCIGVDPAGERMREVSWRASRKPARGGRPNALFVVASVQALPEELAGLAHTLTLNFPWASLLSALVLPEAPVLEALRRLVRPGGELIALLNQSVFDDRPYAARLGLPELSDAWIDDALRPAYRAAGFEIRASELVDGEVPHQTSWGQHLTLASGRRTRLLTAEAIGGSASAAPG
ncbi:class I SAM-dependent methyltransferase [Sorangium sp. So ce341]|uniref:class I SAM-dependent methyltransferase n=2 Tax=unclassified Sorangium TaxID=2621164 RepID=UPI003F626AE0